MRPIDADALNEAIERDFDGVSVYDVSPSEAVSDFQSIVDIQPTIQPEPQWIPISDRLPRDGTWNIFTDGKNISVERYKADAIDHFFPNGRWFQLEDVIAWMSLPEPYKPNNK